MAETLTLNFRTLSLITLKPQMFMTKITVAILRLLPETNGCGNFKTMSLRSVTEFLPQNLML